MTYTEKYEINRVQEVANTILFQMGGRGKISAMTGAEFSISSSDLGVSFRFKMFTKANHCKITLNWDDTYTMTFTKIKKFDFVTVKEISGLYHDMLKHTFEEFTGLRLSL